MFLLCGVFLDTLEHFFLSLIVICDGPVLKPQTAH
jgi:hypothetical protein